MSTDAEMADIAQAARAALEQRGMSIRKLAGRVGMKPDTVADFLAGQGNTRRSTRISICRELGLNPDSGQPA